MVVPVIVTVDLWLSGTMWRRTDDNSNNSVHAGAMREWRPFKRQWYVTIHINAVSTVMINL